MRTLLCDKNKDKNAIFTPFPSVATTKAIANKTYNYVLSDHETFTTFVDQKET